MKSMCIRPVLVTLLTMGMCLPLLAEPTSERGGQRAAEGRAGRGKLTDEGRAILKSHREQQREQMQAQLALHREAQGALREVMADASDPHKQLDLLEAHIRARQDAMSVQQEQNQQTRVAAYTEALRVSGVPDAELEQVLAQMQARQAQRTEKYPAQRDAVLEEIARMRANPDLTVQDVRAFAKRGARAGRDRRGKEGRAGRDENAEQGAGRMRRERAEGAERRGAGSRERKQVGRQDNPAVE